jgi:hypothetical protein
MNTRGSRATLVAVMASATLGALAVVSWQFDWFGSGGSSLLAVAQIPPRLPNQGVQLDGGAIVLTPWTTAPSGAMSGDQAIAAVRHLADLRRRGSDPPGLLAELRAALPATALKVEISLPGRWPPGSTQIRRAHTINRLPVWLVTFTSSKPIDASGGALTPFYVTQFSEAVNPVTGRVVFGFETPAGS